MPPPRLGTSESFLAVAEFRVKFDLLTNSTLATHPIAPPRPDCMMDSPAPPAEFMLSPAAVFSENAQ